MTIKTNKQGKKQGQAKWLTKAVLGRDVMPAAMIETMKAITDEANLNLAEVGFLGRLLSLGMSIGQQAFGDPGEQVQAYEDFCFKERQDKQLSNVGVPITVCMAGPGNTEITISFKKGGYISPLFKIQFGSMIEKLAA